MKLVDVNVLVYAVDKAANQHAAIARWWRYAMLENEPIGIPWIVLVGFLRIMTNRRIFVRPLSISEALELVDEWLSSPAVSVISESRQHASVLRELLAAVPVAGDHVTDAHLAALAISHGAVLYSCDNDFAMFPKLRWTNPLVMKH